MRHRSFDSGELGREATVREFRTVQTEGSRQVARRTAHYNLDAIISVGYRVNSLRATQFRQWATRVLRDFTLRGYVLDRERMEAGFLDQVLTLGSRELLKNAGSVAEQVADAHAASEYQTYRIRQDAEYLSDFDAFAARAQAAAEEHEGDRS